jgi:hypothetical protein
LRFTAAIGLVLLAAPALGEIARAEGVVHPKLELLAADKLQQLAPLLYQSDIALVESRPDGTMKQVTVIMFVAAKPETVHDVVANPGGYGKFIPGLSKSTWDKQADGRYAHTWQLDLPVSSFDGCNVYDFEPGPSGAVILHAIDPNDEANFRWEMLPVPGGTVLVNYGYTDVKHSNKFVKSFLKRIPMMEHGLALAAQLVIASPMRKEAERRANASELSPRDTKAKSPGFNFLLERGMVTVMRQENGRLSDVSVLDRAFAPLQQVADAITHPAQWSKFIHGVDESYERSRSEGVIEYRSVMSVPLVSWDTVYQMRVAPAQMEGMGMQGDLRGAHYQWDLVNRGPKETLTIYRVKEPLAQSSIILRKLFQSAPSLEQGLGVAFGLVYVRAMRGKAEGWAVK